jgi:hypothetical protein
MKILMDGAEPMNYMHSAVRPSEPAGLLSSRTFQATCQFSKSGVLEKEQSDGSR